MHGCPALPYTISQKAVGKPDRVCLDHPEGSFLLPDDLPHRFNFINSKIRPEQLRTPPPPQRFCPFVRWKTTVSRTGQHEGSESHVRCHLLRAAQRCGQEQEPVRSTPRRARHCLAHRDCRRGVLPAKTILEDASLLPHLAEAVALLLWSACCLLSRLL